MVTKEHIRELNRKATAKYRVRHRDRHLTNKRKNQRQYTLRTKFGLSIDEYNKILAQQNSKCAICHKEPFGDDRYRAGKNLAVDHDHVTGKVRGLLCDLCNRALGQFQDSPEFLRRAAQYVEHPTISQL